jgi:hypothetical protein
MYVKNNNKKKRNNSVELDPKRWARRENGPTKKQIKVKTMNVRALRQSAALTWHSQLGILTRHIPLPVGFAVQKC